MFTETLTMLQHVYGDYCISRTQCYGWFTCFKARRTSIDENPRPGPPLTSISDDNIYEVHTMIHEGRRLTVRETAEELGVSVGSCHGISTNLRVYVADITLPDLSLIHI